MDPFLASVRHTLTQSRMIAQGERVLVALSGGADSVALLAALLDLGHPLTAAHFNHGWRGDESDADEAFARALCDELGVELAVGHGSRNRGTGDGGAEQAARLERYAFLAAVARAHGCTRIATGHTRDDQAETVLMRALRGSGPQGLAAIRRVREDGVVRPLLDVGRSEVLAYIARRSLRFVEDSSNLDHRFTRNRIRLDVMPQLRQLEPAVVRRLAGLADEMAEVAQRDEQIAAEILKRVCEVDGGLVLARLSEWPLGLRSIAVRAWLRRQRGDLRRIDAAHIDAVVGCDRSGTKIELPRGNTVVNEHGVLRLDASDAAPLEQSAELGAGATLRFGAYDLVVSAIEARDAASARLPEQLWEAVVDAERAPLPWRVRYWRAGDRVQPLGMHGHRKLSDVFIDAKVPRWQRHALPVLESRGEVLWVPGVVRAAAGAVDATTSSVVRIAARPRSVA